MSKKDSFQFKMRSEMRSRDLDISTRELRRINFSLEVFNSKTNANPEFKENRMTKLLFVLVVAAMTLPTISARADVPGVVPGTDQYDVANNASAISKVVSFKIGTGR